MDSPTLAAWAGPLLTAVIAGGPLLARRTLHGNARTQLQRADLMRRARIDDLADAHERSAREYLLRPVVMKERGVVSHLSWGDLMTISIAMGMLLVPPALGFSLRALGIFIALATLLVIVMLREDHAVKKACAVRAAGYEVPAQPTKRRWPPLATGLLLLWVGTYLTTLRGPASGADSHSPRAT